MSRIFIYPVIALVSALAFGACSSDKEKDALSGQSMHIKTIRGERRAIKEGNKLVEEGNLGEALAKYNEALRENPESAVAKFNIAMTQINLAKSSQANDSTSQKLMEAGVATLNTVAQLGFDNPDVSSKAFYNLGNLAFEQKQYGQAIEMYKNSLRINQNFFEARRNLRIAQLQPRDDKGGGGDNQENQEQQQEQQQDQQQEQQQDQNQEQQKEQQDQQPPKENEISPQAAEQILNAVENNENQTRARRGHEDARKAAGTNTNLRKW